VGSDANARRHFSGVAIFQPTLLLADEPTGNLPSQQGEEVLSIFSRLNDEGMTIVLVTLDINIGMCGNRLIRLCDGRIQEDQPTGQPMAVDRTNRA